MVQVLHRKISMCSRNKPKQNAHPKPLAKCLKITSPPQKNLVQCPSSPLTRRPSASARRSTRCSGTPPSPSVTGCRLKDCWSSGLEWKVYTAVTRLGWTLNWSNPSLCTIHFKFFSAFHNCPLVTIYVIFHTISMFVVMTKNTLALWNIHICPFFADLTKNNTLSPSLEKLEDILVPKFLHEKIQ